MPPDAMPRLRRDDVVSNANDSYWLTNPAAPLEGFSPIIGPERTPRSLRTRAGLTFIAEALKPTDRKATPETLQEMLFSQRNFGAELLLDDVLSLCARAGRTGRTRQRARRHHGLVPGAVQRGTARKRSTAAAPRCGASSGASPRACPVCTACRSTRPTRRTRRVALAVDQPGVREALRRALAQAQQRLAQFGVAPDATLGSIQFEERNGERIPIPGGDGRTGMWSVISSELKPSAYTPIVAGNSYIQVVGWTNEGRVDPRGILTYSQSEDPASPHFADQTKLYSKGQWLRLPFHEKDILADKNLRTLRLTQ